MAATPFHDIVVEDSVISTWKVTTMSASTGLDRITDVVCDGTGLTREEVRMIGTATLVAAVLTGLLRGVQRALNAATRMAP